jgi:hypothetical protein
VCDISASCSEKKIRSAYHIWCSDCAKGADVCPKCLQNREIVQQEVAALTQEQIQEMLVQVGMKERVRRRIWRLWENDKATDEELKEMILNYNPDREEAPTAEDLAEEEAEAEAARQKALAAKRGPPPKPKAAAQTPIVEPAAAAAVSAAAPAASASAAKSTAASTAEEEEDDEEDEDGEDEDDFDDDDDQDAADAAEMAAERARQKMATASISETST